ncbi:MAG: chemotaxis protein CheW [Pseudomonadota bacterium]
MTDQSDEPTSAAQELVSFRVAGQKYCVDIMSVREIRGWTQATPIPHAPPFVRGVINLRGAVLPIVDLAARLGQDPTEPTARHAIIVVQMKDQLVGVLVESVSDILSIDGQNVQPTPEVASDVDGGFVRGVIALEDEMIRYIDLMKVMPQTKIKAA